MPPDRADKPYPDAAEAAARIAFLYGLRNLVDVGLSWTTELALGYPRLRVTGVVPPADERGGTPAPYPFGPRIDLTDSTAARGLNRLIPTATAVLATGTSRSLCGSEGALSALSELVAAAALIVVAVDDAGPVLSLLDGMGLRPEFVGRTRVSGADDERSGHLIVVDRQLARIGREPAPAPDDFRVVAIMTAYNEEDVVGPAVQKLIDDGVGVYVIDNWSTDRTYEIVRGFEGRGLVGSERFPAAPSDRFVLEALTKRVTAVADGLRADWFIHHDADERRHGPWPGVGLRDSLWRVDRAGFSAVDHTVINYRPVDDTFDPGGDFESHFRYFELGRTGDLMIQIKAWKNVGRVDLASSGGHEARFDGRRVFPYKFLLRHYPIRSQVHGEQKILRDRIGRWDPRERARGWHIHYDDVVPEQSFLRDPAGLIEDEGPETRTRYMPELLTGAGLMRPNLPGWALGSAPGRTVYLKLWAVAHSPLRPVVVASRTLIRTLRTGARGR